MWSSIKHHIIVFACLLLAMRFIATPCWANDSSDVPNSAVMQQTASQLIDVSAEPVAPIIAETWRENSSGKPSDFLDSTGTNYRCADLAELGYSGGLVGSGSGHLRAPPIPLWLLHRSLLL
ncbi:MAG: hypothetical protein K2W95_20215 [Candidatus Obscuribacterales bacterium]|nr:hypothetical protein [Candidatus Obscuribacterales bacterium]